MSCERFRVALTDHACGAPLHGAAAAHLATCSECRTLLEEERRIVLAIQDDLDRALSVSASPGFSAQVTARLQRVSSIGVRKGYWAALAAAATLALAAYLVPGHTVQQPQPGGAMPVVIASQPAETESDAGRGWDAALQPWAYQGRRTGHVVRALPRGDRASGRTVEGQHTERLVARTQLEAIARVRELALIGALDEASLPLEAPQPSPPAELVIAPLAVQEIVIPDVTHTVPEAATQIE